MFTQTKHLKLQKELHLGQARKSKIGAKPGDQHAISNITWLVNEGLCPASSLKIEVSLYPGQPTVYFSTKSKTVANHVTCMCPFQT